MPVSLLAALFDSWQVDYSLLKPSGGGGSSEEGDREGNREEIGRKAGVPDSEGRP